jgi:hypothetical protein
MHRQAMGQGPLAEISFKQKALLRVELLKRSNEPVQFGLHTASNAPPTGGSTVTFYCICTSISRYSGPLTLSVPASYRAFGFH